MKTLTRLLLCAALLATAMAARAERTYSQAELDALLAPVALYPDSVLSNILVAASYPEDVREAAAWSRGNPQLRGDEALRLVENLPWHPSVKALVATPEILQRMDESPAWLRDLGEAYRAHGPYVMETVQALRQRAQANGYPPGAIAPAPSGVVYVRYYDPYVVYGPWWWPAYRPIVWRPFPLFVVVSRPVYAYRPVVVQPPIRHVQFRPAPEPQRYNGPPSPAERQQQKYARERQKDRAQQNPRSERRESHRPPSSAPPRQSRSEPKGKFAAPEPRGRGEQQHRGSRNRD